MNKKTIWITGGSTGIGKALALKFANEGWNVAISARRENLLKEISDKNENIHGFPLDVTDKIKCMKVFENNDKFNIGDKAYCTKACRSAGVDESPSCIYGDSSSKF